MGAHVDMNKTLYNDTAAGLMPDDIGELDYTAPPPQPHKCNSLKPDILLKKVPLIYIKKVVDVMKQAG